MEVIPGIFVRDEFDSGAITTDDYLPSVILKSTELLTLRSNSYSLLLITTLHASHPTKLHPPPRQLPPLLHRPLPNRQMGSLRPLRTAQSLPIPRLHTLCPDRLLHRSMLGILSYPLPLETLPSPQVMVPFGGDSGAVNWSD
jgi:hypothetical protein